ncbi:MAG: enoyl-CoA hydratase/isomerase family protein [Deltaproteobacteria bacterium]|nr:enoyl-CoA hydratase/isomerase family protein [Deltaproteobacteria bacterium]MBW1949801.1 enoyl-CoA hydratase/isomerase family protein [Deltaproteobacteria bacterium]MBW2348170.1 enoyl-CoA hydratase/isomerase family protein [Deltaproteobacteria bacterium]RLB36947.1 MAG: enoyl-CoA hydratase [Deltaproteobacteria bacterium]
MAYKYITYEERERIGILTLNRPEKRNALGKAAELEMMDCFRKASEKRSVRVIIIRGNGPVFCSGHDKAEILNRPINDVREMFQTCVDMYALMHDIPQPIIAQVHGIAMAGGCHLVAGCDLAVAAEKGALFAMTGVKIGYNCSTPTVAVSRAIGQKKTLEMLFTGNFISAREALQYGLVNRVVPDEKLEEETWNLAKEIAQYSLKVLGIGKQHFYQQIDMPERQAYHYAKELMSSQALWPDAVEGMTAMNEKREPIWPEE